jgi:microcystin-dependent protein
MSQPYVGQILMFGGNFAPAGWMICNGQTLPISENDVLFQLIGTTYGGDGESTFQLPNLGGRIPVHMGQGPGLSNYAIGQSAGVESVTLTVQQIPQHSQLAVANANPGTISTPAVSSILATEAVSNGTNNPYTYAPYDSATQVTLPSSAIGTAGGSQPHENIQPVLAVTICISLFGVFPTPT